MAINKGIVGIGDASTPVVPSDNFNTVLYTGDGTTGRSIPTGLDADLVIIKNRSSALQDWIWTDSVRGVSKVLRSNRDSQFYNAGSGQGVSAFGTGTVTIGDNDAGNTGVNGDVGGTFSGAALHAMYTFKGGGTAVSNTDGTITSQVSANTAAGFSIVSYTGASGTVGHGLNSTPEIIIQKKTNGSEDWHVYFPPGVIDSNYNYMILNSTAGKATTGSTPPTTTTFNPVSNSGNYIAYAFHSVAGYSKIGSYTGQTNGVTITTGFQPRFIMVKSSSNVENWAILDTVRGSGKVLNPNRLNAETDSTLNTFTVSSTGFSFPNQSTADAMLNENGYEYIYMAFA